ncbi:MAG: hypothetical protein E7318_02605 [Clostridiales bacterium]|nr:hypothetical protein [Clostridiales bacterium]
MQNKPTPAPRKRPEIVRILIYTGITLGVNLALSIPYNLVFNALVQGLLINGGMSSDVFNVISWIFGSMHTYGLCIIEGLLFRRLVFRSKFNAFLPILVMCGLKDIIDIIRTIVGPILLAQMSIDQYVTTMNIFSYATLLIVAVLGYVIMRCGFYKRTLDTLVKQAEPCPAEDFPCSTNEGV